MTDYIKRIQSRISSKGAKIARSELIEQIKVFGFDPENLSDELTDLITTKLLDKFINFTREPDNNLLISDLNDTPSDSNHRDEKIKDYAEIDKNNLRIPAPDSEIDKNNSSEIVVGEGKKHELITAQASCLGIELSEVEVVDLASEIKDDFLDYESFIEEIVGVIVTYNDNRTSGLEQKIKDAREHIESRRKQLNKTLVGEFAEMNNFFRQGEAKRKELSKVIAAAFKT
ncbi:hypothetical protein [Brunnivagina elsteri]|uniref:Uncharacterized protein n=1 Tax=Brunnivagina elsteri CCALA 953 TaxID=987040 RepID=A0A2A2TP98_9CYAN|nr:hypothetical protein [Calothrix elsteri]PAX60237.1 hypothetical protein CK510_02855 [Calothrix elsteri CCALA 953]